MDKGTLLNLRQAVPDHGFNFVADIPTVFHCHHFNLFWDQTIDDALGAELGTVIRTSAAREAFYDLLAGLATRAGASRTEDILALAKSVFQMCGQGQLTFETNGQGGNIIGDYLHYSVAWNEKYGQVRRKHPVDGVAAGFSAAAIELAHGALRNSVRCREIQCAALDASRCQFRAEVGDPGPLTSPMGRLQVARAISGPEHGLHEDRIEPIVDGLRAMTSGLFGDERGLIQSFGLFVSELPTTYYNRSGYDALRHLSRTAPNLLPVMQSLLREAGHVCVFNTFGSIMVSPEWEGLVGAPSGDHFETLTGLLAVARALGMGRWAATEFKPGERLVLRSPSTYEAAYYVNREGRSTESQCFFYQGAAVGLMQLIERVNWQEQPTFDGPYYTQLFRSGLPWDCEETLCVSKGDPYCEVVVTRRESRRTYI